MRFYYEWDIVRVKGRAGERLVFGEAVGVSGRRRGVLEK